MLKNSGIITATIAASSLLAMASTATASTLVKVTIENLAPTDGTVITPLWVGFHDGNFDIYDRGAPASASLERIAEDGDTAPITSDFSASGAGTVQGTILGAGLGPNTPPVIPPNTTATAKFTLDGTLASSQYFSYAAMLVPSNDAFFANGDPLEHKIFDDNGNFLGADFIILGSEILDAGTEDNDEIPANTALLGQATPNTGVTTVGGTVAQHPGFIPNGNILTAFPGADFTTSGYQVARIRVEEVQVPESENTVGLLLLGGLFLVSRRLRWQN